MGLERLISISRKRALEYAEKLISTPRSHVRVVLRQTKGGVTLIHNRKALTKCYINRSGMRAAAYMAQALGVKVPALGESVIARISTGVLWRAVSISDMDFRKKESYPVLERLLMEAAMQRGGAVSGV